MDKMVSQTSPREEAEPEEPLCSTTDRLSVALRRQIQPLRALRTADLRGPAGRALTPLIRQVAALADRLVDEFSDGYRQANEIDREEAAAAAERARVQAEVAARQLYVGASLIPAAWVHMGWRQPDGTPVAMARLGGQIIFAAGAIGAGKSQAALSLIDGALHPRPGLASEAQPPTAVVAIHTDLSGVGLPELLAAARKNPRATDQDRLRTALAVEPAALPRVRLVVPSWLLEDFRQRIERELGPGFPVDLRPLRLRLGQLGMRALEALLGCPPGDVPQYLEEILRAAAALGEALTVAELRRLIQEAPRLNAGTREQALGRLLILEKLEDPEDPLAADLWDVVEPGVLTIFCLAGRWLRRREVLPLVVALLNGVSQPSLRHGPLQRLILLDEVNQMSGDPVLWEHLVATARLIRHGGSTLWIAGQDFLGLPDELLGLATQFLCFRLRSAKILRHLRERVAGFGRVRLRQVAELLPGMAYWMAVEATDARWRGRALRCYLRPPTCEHGGHTRATL